MLNVASRNLYNVILNGVKDPAFKNEILSASPQNDNFRL